MSLRIKLLRWGFWFSAFTGLLLALISTQFIEFMPVIEGFKANLFLATGLFSHFSVIALLVFLFVITPVAVLMPSSAFWIRLIIVIIASLGTVLLLADTLVYAQYRFHITGFIFDMLIEAGDDVIAVSWVTWLISISIIIVTFIGYWIGSSKLWIAIKSPGLTRFKYPYSLVLLISWLTSNLVHLYADAEYDQRVTSLVRHIPLFSPATAKEFIYNSGWIDEESMNANRHNMKHSSSDQLNYPHEKVNTSLAEKPLSVLLIVLDSARYDTLDKETMPALTKFSNGKHAQVYPEHISGGNSTRTGMFNLFYGIPGTYWTAFSNNRVSPVLMDTFQKYDYEMGIFAAAPLTHPAFDRTIFSNIKNLKLRADGDEPWELDQNITDNWIDFIESRGNNKHPFFGFLFYDGIHGISVPPNGEKPFQPSWERVDHLSLNKELDGTEYFNLYKNSVYHVDKQLKRVFKQLESKKLLDETIVIITSDHGQEFNDNGMNYWGHGSNFTPTQVHVPLVVHWPGKGKVNYKHRTSHSDISVTLIQDLFNSSSNPRDYSLGYNLKETERSNWTIAGSYVNYAVIEKDRHIVTYQSGQYEILDQSGRSSINQTLPAKQSLEIMEALSRFYKN